MINQFIQFGSKKIEYQVLFSERKTLGITVDPEMEIIVKSPIGVSLEKIEEKVRKKAPWILKQQDYFLGFFPKMPKRKFISGETHLYLGRAYLLKSKQKRKR